MTSKRTLWLSNRFTDDSNRLWKAGIESGWRVRRVGLSEVALGGAGEKIDAVHAEVLFVQALQEARPDLSLRSLPPTWLAGLPLELLGRRMFVESLSIARKRDAAAFIKPTIDKQFEARVYLPSETVASFVEGDPDVLVSDPVRFVTEARAFCLPSGMLAGSIYERDGVVAPAELGDADPPVRRVIRDLVDGGFLTEPSVVDVGQLDTGKWVVIEANPAWGSGLYACDPVAVLEVLAEACA